MAQAALKVVETPGMVDKDKAKAKGKKSGKKGKKKSKKS